MAQQQKLGSLGLASQPGRLRDSQSWLVGLFARPAAKGIFPMRDSKANDWMQTNLARSDYLQAAIVATACATSAAGTILGSWVLLRDGSLFNMPTRWLMLLGCSAAVSGLAAAWQCLRRARYDRALNRMVDELRD